MVKLKKFKAHKLYSGLLAWQFYALAHIAIVLCCFHSLHVKKLLFISPSEREITARAHMARLAVDYKVLIYVYDARPCNGLTMPPKMHRNCSKCAHRVGRSPP
jgi:hypothetical protein